METDYKIDLSQYIEKSLKGLVGRDNGEALLNKIQKEETLLNYIEKSHSKIVIQIPPQIRLINKSFFLGFFETRIQELGKEKFMNKYEFITDKKFILESLYDYIDYAVLTATPGDILNV
jgi:hypothetical protein